jgi:S-DNA-T family DNA segregation ATPase FtsK/SpoIIIE
LREVVESKEFSNSKAKLAYCLGKDIGGNCIVSDLTKMPIFLLQEQLVQEKVYV